MLNCAGMAVKKVLVGIEEEVWQRVRLRAIEEQRTVALLVENALKLYLGGPVATMLELSQPLEPRVTTVREGLERLVAAVHGAANRPETPREQAQRIAERQAYLRDHPEEETQ